ncbi:MAG: hypothetical protein WCG03_00380 [Kiritimatiellales bacterium]
MNKQPPPYLCHIFVCANIRENYPENPGCGAKGGGKTEGGGKLER